MNTVAIVAHYNEESVFSQAFLDIINVIGRNVNEIVIISTSKFERLPPQLNSNNIHVYYRPNFGYDFYSYKLGLELLGLKNLHNFGVLLLNSSFSISDPNKFEKAISRALGKSGNQVIGLTLSNQIARHLQSFFLFSPKGHSRTKLCGNFLALYHHKVQSLK